MQVWDATTGGNALTYQGHGSDEFSVTWSPDGKYIAAVDGVLQVLDATTGTIIFDDKGLGVLTTVAWSPDSTRVIVGKFGHNLKVVDIATQASTLSLQDQAGLFTENAVAWSPDGKYIASGSGGGGGGHVSLWDANTGKAIFTDNMSPGTALAWSPNGKFIAAATNDGLVVVLEAE